MSPAGPGRPSVAANATSGCAAERGVDLAEFDAEAADLHLEVGAAEVLERARSGSPPHEVAGAVHPLARARRTGRRRTVRRSDRAGGGSRGPGPDPAMYSSPATPDRHRLQPRVEHHLGDAADRAADRDRLARHQRFADVRHRSWSRWARTVEHAAPRRPAGHQFRRARLPADHDVGAVVEPGRVDDASAAGVTKACVTRCCSQQLGQFLAAVHGAAARSPWSRPPPNASRYSSTEASKLGDEKCRVRDAGGHRAARPAAPRRSSPGRDG